MEDGVESPIYHKNQSLFASCDDGRGPAAILPYVAGKQAALLRFVSLIEISHSTPTFMVNSTKPLLAVPEYLPGEFE